MFLAEYLTDPVLRAPTIGSMMMCLASSLVGVLVFIQKRSLVGETLSHASFPGVVISALIASIFFPASEEFLTLSILVGAFVSSLIGLFFIELLEKRFHIKSDLALSFILAVFFGFGVLIASHIQATHSLFYQKALLFLFGQAATMTDIHIVIYTVLVGIILVSIIALYHTLAAAYFDRSFASCLGINVKLIDTFSMFLICLAIVTGVRCVGVVLMSGMLIAPVVTARQWTNRLSRMFWLAGTFGVLSAFLGNFFSLEISEMVRKEGALSRFSIPTGPTIVLISSFLCFLSLLLAPERGLLTRFYRRIRFKQQTLMENILKTFWRKQKAVSLEEIAFWQSCNTIQLRLSLFMLTFQGWVKKKNGHFALTQDGVKKAARIVRLHRLWEVYLVDYLGQNKEKVHHNAEELEHVMTPELEHELTELLSDPKHDPHEQPIPSKNDY